MNFKINELHIDECDNKDTDDTIREIVGKINPKILKITLSKPGIRYWN